MYGPLLLSMKILLQIPDVLVFGIVKILHKYNTNMIILVLQSDLCETWQNELFKP